LVISPDEMNNFISNVIVSPMTTKARGYPTRVVCKFKGKLGEIVFDQIRTVDRARLVKRLGTIDSKTKKKTLFILQKMFAE
jgi:mRNA interferase MazF